MDFQQILDLMFNLDKNLLNVVQHYGTLSYLLIFLVIFGETGFVVTPFLPGDSLLFALGALASIDVLSVWVLYPLLIVAAILGDNLNYWIGHLVGERVLGMDNRLIKKKHIDQAQDFYKKHGSKAIILARFVPFARTFVPFIAGISRMKYINFLYFNIIGTIVWVTIFLFGGYFFGNLSYVRDNFLLVLCFILIMSMIPFVFEVFRKKVLKRQSLNNK